MFFFGKKKKAAEQPAAEAKPVVDRQELVAQAEQRKAALESAPDKAARIRLLNEIGSLYFQAEEVDQAIVYYEKSLEEDKQLGKAYTDQLKLYNLKRQEAAAAKDDANLTFYMNKVQELMQLSKDVIRGKV